MATVEELISRVLALNPRPDPKKVEEEARRRTCPLGCPDGLRPGSKVRDPVTGLEGEVIAYGRASWLAPPPGTEG